MAFETQKLDWHELNSEYERHLIELASIKDEMTQHVADSGAWLKGKDVVALLTDSLGGYGNIDTITDEVPLLGPGCIYIVTGREDYEGFFGQGRTISLFAREIIAGKIEQRPDFEPSFIGRICLLSETFSEFEDNGLVPVVDSDGGKHPILAEVGNGELYPTDIKVHFGVSSAFEEREWGRHGTRSDKEFFDLVQGAFSKNT